MGMARRPTIAEIAEPFRRCAGSWPAGATEGETVALVPTMGALHAGNLAGAAGAAPRRPRGGVDLRQPGAVRANEDFSTYPRTFAADVAMLAEEKADLVWAPATSAVMYPEGFATRIVPEGPATAGLEDTFRPDFFKGVATVVAKLFIQVAPDIAVFGEKDYQQLKVVTRMARDLDLPLQGHRRADRAREGRPRDVVAQRLSLGRRARGGADAASRAQAVREEDRRRPIRSRRSWRRAARRSSAADLCSTISRRAMPRHWRRSRSVKDGPVRLLVAAKLGTTRLIDNVGVAEVQRGEPRRPRMRPPRDVTPNAGSSAARPAPCR